MLVTVQNCEVIVVLTTALGNQFSSYMCMLLLIRAITDQQLSHRHRRRLVIKIWVTDIGGQTFGSQILGGQKFFGKFIFRQKS